jgi:hypothetical protein
MFKGQCNTNKRFKDMIKIVDWTGRILFEGDYRDKQVDKVLDVNRCNCNDRDNCNDCNGSGYWGDFEINWLDSNNDRNIYEYVNY